MNKNAKKTIKTSKDVDRWVNIAEIGYISDIQIVLSMKLL